MEWISLKDELPEEYQEVLTLKIYRCQQGHEYKECLLDYRVELDEDDREWVWARRTEEDQDAVTHWLPIPELPQIT